MKTTTVNTAGNRRAMTILTLTGLAAAVLGTLGYAVAVVAAAGEARHFTDGAYVRLMIAMFAPPPVLAATTWAAILTLRRTHATHTRPAGHDRLRRTPLIDASDIADWIASLPAGARVGIDDDTLVAHDRHDRPLGPDTTLEVGDRIHPEDID